MAVKILACTCKHEFQDAKYGKGMRVHNSAKKLSTNATKTNGFRCSVCAGAKTTGGDEK